MDRQMVRRISLPINYSENSDDEEVVEISDIVEDILSETVDKGDKVVDTITTETESGILHKKKQYLTISLSISLSLSLCLSLYL